MCATCGCSDEPQTTITDVRTGAHSHPGQAHGHTHEPGERHTHSHEPQPRLYQDEARPSSRIISFEQEVLAKNDLLAERNRGWLAARGVLAVNLMSSPGAGKTTLLERTIRDLDGQFPMAVVEGDQETLLDAERIRATGAPVLQINTGSGCHLDAAMLGGALQTLDPVSGSVLFVENVGNLVCPALFDLGERAKVVIISVTEGADKPLKYPHMFRAADLLVVNKTDLVPYVDFDVARCVAYAKQVNPRITALEVSATAGDGLDGWYGWLRAEVAAAAP